MAYAMIRELEDCAPCGPDCDTQGDQSDGPACACQLHTPQDGHFICTRLRGHDPLLDHRACAHVDGVYYHAVAEWSGFDYAEAS